MHSLERTLRELGYKTTRVRSGEVVLVTIPCSSLFAPNSIELKTKASGVLSQLLPYIRRSDNYKVIVAVRTPTIRATPSTPTASPPTVPMLSTSFFFSRNGNREYRHNTVRPRCLTTNPWLRIRSAKPCRKQARVGCTVPTSTFIDKTRNR